VEVEDGRSGDWEMEVFWRLGFLSNDGCLDYGCMVDMKGGMRIYIVNTMQAPAG
jgi:hypothetical protein